MIFNEQVHNESAEQAKLFASKMKNLRQHLQALASKKARLELEISSLKKTIAEKEKNYSKSVKLSLALEQDQVLTPEQANLLLTESPVLFQALSDLNQEFKLCHKAIELYDL